MDALGHVPFVATLFGLSPADWTAIAAWSAVGAALVAGYIARGQLREAQRLRRAQAQPYVVVFMEASEASAVMIDLVIKNFGATAAHNVGDSIDPAPLSAALAEEGPIHIPSEIPVLVPGQEWRTLWDTGIARYPSDLPKRHVATVQFADQDGHASAYDFILDWDALFYRKRVTVYGSHDTAKALREIAKTMKAWTETGHGLKAVVRDGDAKDRADLERWDARRAIAGGDRDGHQWLRRARSLPIFRKLAEDPAKDESS